MHIVLKRGRLHVLILLKSWCCQRVQSIHCGSGTWCSYAAKQPAAKEEMDSWVNKYLLWHETSVSISRLKYTAFSESEEIASCDVTVISLTMYLSRLLNDYYDCDFAPYYIFPPKLKLHFIHRVVLSANIHRHFCSAGGMGRHRVRMSCQITKCSFHSFWNAK